MRRLALALLLALCAPPTAAFAKIGKEVTPCTPQPSCAMGSDILNPGKPGDRSTPGIQNYRQPDKRDLFKVD